VTASLLPPHIFLQRFDTIDLYGHELGLHHLKLHGTKLRSRLRVDPIYDALPSRIAFTTLLWTPKYRHKEKNPMRGLMTAQMMKRTNPPVIQHRTIEAMHPRKAMPAAARLIRLLGWEAI
jgi:hypothetical protein